MNKLRIVLLGCSIVLVWTALALAQPQYPDFPEDFPQHESCQMVQVMEMQDNQTAMLDCGTTPMTEVYDFYLKQARGGDWQILFENKSADFMLFMAEKEPAVMQVQVATEDGKTQLGLSLVKKK